MSEKQIYFLGIGGIGMSALARYYKAKGYDVSGYDRTQTQLTRELESEGINIHYNSSMFNVQGALNVELSTLNVDTTLVVYTPAVPQDFEEFVYLKNNGFRMLKRAQVLGEITRESRGICIAGTHGKTTTSTMTAHLLYQSQVGCSAFLGGVSKNYDTNLLLDKQLKVESSNFNEQDTLNFAPSTLNSYVVIEADEYDRSFHQLSPYMALITAADADHLDIYGSAEEFKHSFEKFASLVKENGFLIINEKVDLNVKSNAGVKRFSYGMHKGDFHAENINIENGEITFDFVTPTETVKNIQLGVPVLINVENGVGAMALAYLAGVTADELRAGMQSFKGIRRRFDIQVKTDKLVYLDDYAHHPEELRASITSIKTLYPNRKICGIFQPHLYTRTRDFAAGFAETLSLLDELILVDIYPARELPIEGVSSDMIFEKVTIKNKMRAKKEELLGILKDKEIDVLVTFGAGDIDAYVGKIRELLEKK
ncbi:MAG: UDP-N-acetylmuramate--L-alanine ligase [Prevotellaceae bacterium]|jgi:UDP-N-acetylmuramate--alanine ligase|nr:UDP-N-acetylmuramate--L-alanine ligase [Prevotellaceae bacterium]